jgi:hypothetical protein
VAAGELGMLVDIKVAPAELLDKVTILEIKKNYLKDPEKLRNVDTELAILTEIMRSAFKMDDVLKGMYAELMDSNRENFDETEIIMQRLKVDDLSSEMFLSSVRKAFLANAARAGIKRRINVYLGSGIIEEKSW